MTRDEIIRMAREARLAEPYHPFNPWGASQEALERFAAIVEKHLIASGYRKCAEGQRTTQFCGQLEAAVLAENEACAKACEATDDGTPYNLTSECAAAIRARRQK